MSVRSITPPPLSTRQKRILLTVTAIIAMSRLLAPASSLMDWDEALFSLAVEEYEVPGHHPHPPGYPLFIAAAKLPHLFGVSEFRSLQIVVVFGAMLLFPACFALARELGLSFPVAIAGSAIFSFLPNVWVHGGTAFSDVPATAVAFAACALLLRGRSDTRAFILGAAVLGIAAGVRPTNLLIGAVPALLATVAQLRARSYGAVAAALTSGFVITCGSYVGAALASSSVEGFIGIVETQSDYIRRVDSWRSPTRMSLPQAARVFFLHPFGRKAIGNAIAFAAIVGLVSSLRRRQPSALILLAMYVPAALISWISFDVAAASRYAINYMALHALLAACGLFALGAMAARRAPRQAAVIGAVLCAALIGWMAGWTFEALVLQRTQDSPVAAALKWVAANVPADAPVYVHASLTPHATFLLRGRPWMRFENEEEIAATGVPGWMVRPSRVPGVKQFLWPHDNPLWRVIRSRNFEATVSETSLLANFVDGWYGEESDRGSYWRWMSEEGRVLLPQLPGGSARLTLRFDVPLDALPQPPTVVVEVNGQKIDSFVAGTPEVTRSWNVAARPDRPNELTIRTSGTVVPAASGRSSDSRKLGLMLRSISWRPRQ